MAASSSSQRPLLHVDVSGHRLSPLSTKKFREVSKRTHESKCTVANPLYSVTEYPNQNLIVGFGEADDPLHADGPNPSRTKVYTKLYPTPMTVLIRRAKEERDARKAQPCRLLEEPPGNGLLVPELVDVAHRVYRARESVLFGVSKLLDVVLVQRCS